MRKFIQERTMFKILVERTGALFSVTTRRRAYFFFLSTQLIGTRVAPTTDPYPGIVEICDYDISMIVRHWNILRNVKLRSKTKPQRDVANRIILSRIETDGDINSAQQ
jgi:hypothetical protein